MGIDFKATVDGVEKEFSVLNPTQEQRTQAQIVYSVTISKTVQAAQKTKDKPLMRAQLGTLLEGIWTDEDEETVQKINDKIDALVLKLKKGGAKLSEAVKWAFDIIDARNELAVAQAKRNALNEATVESIADNARFDYLVSECTVYKDGGKVFKNVDEYKNSTGDLADKAARNMAFILYQLDPSYQENLPEYKFLKQYGFVDDQLRLIDKQGRLVDRDGRLVNEDGRYINEQGELVNRSGQRVDEKGDLLVEFTQFEE